MYSEIYYKEKKEKLLQRKQGIFQKYVNEAFSFTSDTVFIDEQIKEIELQELESKIQDKPKK